MLMMESYCVVILMRMLILTQMQMLMILVVQGCTNPLQLIMMQLHNITAQKIHVALVFLGCMDGTEDDGNPIALNYNDLDGDAILKMMDVNMMCLVFINIYGCMDPSCFNYDVQLL